MLCVLILIVHGQQRAILCRPGARKAIAALIDPRKAMPAAALLTEAVHRDTIYITVVDRDRMAVSLIYSIFWGFGAGLASSRFGINFQNRGAGFSLVPGHPNEAGGGKRPMHTIIPGMIRRDGRVEILSGLSEGDRVVSEGTVKLRGPGPVRPSEAVAARPAAAKAPEAPAAAVVGSAA